MHHFPNISEAQIGLLEQRGKRGKHDQHHKNVIMFDTASVHPKLKVWFNLDEKRFYFNHDDTGLSFADVEKVIDEFKQHAGLT